MGHMNISGSLATEERLAWVRQQLDAEGRIHIGDAAERLGVSEMTIRRDLAELEGMGLARRVRGGAVAIGPVAFSERHRHRARAKARIAVKLVSLLPSSGAVGIDASSTMLRLATQIEGARDLTVVTNGPETFTTLQGKAGVTPVLTGGSLEPRTGSLVGPIACRTAGNLLLKRFFMSAAAVHPELGASEACLEEAEVKRALAAVAAEVTLAVDSTKLGTRAVAIGVEWDHVTRLVTELDPGDRRLDPYRNLVKIL